jgi:inhibitor of KinA
MIHAGKMDAQFQDASDQSLLVSFGHRISPEMHQHVLKLLRLLESERIDGVRNLHPAYSSLLVKFDPLKLDHATLRSMLQRYVTRSEQQPLPKARKIEIPVCYGGEFGPDLESVAQLRGLTPSQVVELHSAPTYLVYFLGFAPGFAYLGGLPEALAAPRLETPRPKVPQGSVGIGGKQTGVYPLPTPGGWRLIGRTPLSIFCRDQAPPGPMTLLQIGDQVRFQPISKHEFADLRAK